MREIASFVNYTPGARPPAGLAILSTQVVRANPVYEGQLCCSAATCRALEAADLVLASGGRVPVLLAVVIAKSNLAWVYLALSLSSAERESLTSGLTTFHQIANRRRAPPVCTH